MLYLLLADVVQLQCDVLLQLLKDWSKEALTIDSIPAATHRKRTCTNLCLCPG